MDRIAEPRRIEVTGPAPVDICHIISDKCPGLLFLLAEIAWETGLNRHKSSV